MGNGLDAGGSDGEPPGKSMESAWLAFFIKKKKRTNVIAMPPDGSNQLVPAHAVVQYVGHAVESGRLASPI